MKDYLRKTNGHATINHATPRELISSHVARIKVRANQLALFLKPMDLDNSPALSECDRDAIDPDDGPAASQPTEPPLLIPWTKPPSKAFREILLPATTETSGDRCRRAGMLLSCTRRILGAERSINKTIARFKIIHVLWLDTSIVKLRPGRKRRESN